ncbi:hypothetical protein CRP01_06960 [Flavilitoribacter nigricans DSM 23189 = NBRC 102662]|uniref:Uncharacterized protein n=1 Tax=Flavilitoribacter nigricans (strain ATCC 23147 / DSM 23189 / NBRC 102662 / NCIMB 1420 / SS-2) TaxID=1122177 RepID=A0A2D0NHW7_FLAN2|nr:hypothetical protein CRP01_06960 [Flavilitoribacter nigricans DSM 23189 = NBRC 102662]
MGIGSWGELERGRFGEGVTWGWGDLEMGGLGEGERTGVAGYGDYYFKHGLFENLRGSWYLIMRLCFNFKNNVCILSVYTCYYFLMSLNLQIL